MTTSPIGHPILLMPGLDDSGPDHWQSRWQDQFLDAHRVQLDCWDRPNRDTWVDAIDRALNDIGAPTIIVAHSLGCHAVAHWLADTGRSAQGRVAGALLVAPPDLWRTDLDPRLAPFAPVPGLWSTSPLVVVGSDNDPYCDLGTARKLANRWTARFVNAGPFGHINAESRIGDWPYGQYLLASLHLEAMAIAPFTEADGVAIPSFANATRFRFDQYQHSRGRPLQ